MHKNTTGSRIEPPLPARLIGHCLICDTDARARALQTVRHGGMPPGAVHWLCGDCAALVDRRPGLRPIVENCAASGLPFADVMRVFGRLGMTPPTTADDVRDMIRRVCEIRPSAGAV